MIIVMMKTIIQAVIGMVVHVVVTMSKKIIALTVNV